MTKTIVRAVVKENGRYMLVQRAESLGYNQWQFPGGHTDGQHPAYALKREVEEETGLLITDLKVYRQFTNPVTEKKNVIYKCKLKGGNVKLQKEEIKNIGWFTVEQIRRLDITPSTRIIISGMRR